MSLLPFEVKRIIFKNLTTKDLLQCQLVNRQWYADSVELLYSTVTINTTEKSRRYTRTLSNSPQLASYLKRIDIQELLKHKYEEKRFDEHGLLATIIRQCPNLIVIDGKNPHKSFWNRISFAGSRGQLPQIQILPLPPTDDDIESYIYSILHLKSSLTHISITAGSNYEGDLQKTEVYQILLDEISEFKKLQYIGLEYPSNKQLTCFDALIEDCPHVQSISINLSYSEIQRSVTEHENLIYQHLDVHPRPDIHSFFCNWELINNQNQLEYLIHKFPNLQSLKIKCYRNPNNIYCPSGSIVKFLRYAINIPDFSIEFTLADQNIIDVWTELIDMNEMYKDVAIDYFNVFQQSHNETLILKVNKSELIIRCPVPIPLIEIPSTDISFLSKAGSMIRSLAIDRSDGLIAGDDDILSMDRMLQLVQLCPLLQELCLPPPSNVILPGHHPTFQNVDLEKLTITRVHTYLKPASQLIEALSSNCPNIKQLHLINGVHSNTHFFFKLDVPNTKLDLLSWEGISRLNNINVSVSSATDFKVYIRLKTKQRAKIYAGSRAGLSLTNTKQYNEAKKEQLLCFDITCQSLTEFRIETKWLGSTSPYVNFNWTF